MPLPRMVLAGANSGSGKTTLSIGLMAAYTRQGLRVQPFKVGPDFIDPAFHTAVTGLPSRNLDAWLVPERELGRMVRAHAPENGLSIIEGVMGLYDGAGSGAFAGTAHMASLLDAPVVLILNAEGLSLSAAALVAGYAHFRPEDAGADLSGLRIGGVILNRVSGERHYSLLRDAIERHTGVPCFGFLPKGLPSLPHRHLGLVPAQEQPGLFEHVATITEAVERHIDLPDLLRLAQSAPVLRECGVETRRGTVPGPEQTRPHGSETAHDTASRRGTAHTETAPGGAGTPPYDAPIAPNTTAHTARAAYNGPRIGVAKDAAFSFYYQDNLEYLEECGARLVFFSPLADASLTNDAGGSGRSDESGKSGGLSGQDRTDEPNQLDGLYLGGGFPEVYAEQLAANTALRSGLRQALEEGMPAYAECGGMLYLCASLAATDGAEREMTGFFPARAIMTPRLQPFGYVTVTLERDCVLGPAGSRFQAHEFHYSRLEGESAPLARSEKPDGRAWTGGMSRNNAVGWYAHLHFRGCPEAAQSFVNACRAFRARRASLP